MNEVYLEIMVKKKNPVWRRAATAAAGVMAVIFAVLSFMGFWIGLLLAMILGAVCYFLSVSSGIEYEYLYVDKELQIDRIMAKSKRKRMETLDLTQFEILAPLHSHRLDSYSNKNYRTVDYSSGDTAREGAKYVLIANQKRVIFEPTEELVKTVKMFAPRYVFTD